MNQLVIITSKYSKSKNCNRILYILGYQLCMCLEHENKCKKETGICHQLCIVGYVKYFRFKIPLFENPETVAQITPPTRHDNRGPLMTVTEVTSTSHHRNPECCCLPQEQNPVRINTQKNQHFVRVGEPSATHLSPWDPRASLSIPLTRKLI